MTVTAFQQANQLLREGKLEEAVVAYRRAIDQNPQFYGAYQNLGEALGKLGRLDEAVEMYRKAIELKPSAGWLHQELGLLLERLEKPQEAKAALPKDLSLAVREKPPLGQKVVNHTATIQVESKSANHFYLKGEGENKFKEGKLDEAIASYQSGIAHHPDFDLDHHNLDEALDQLSHFEETVKEIFSCFARSKNDLPNFDINRDFENKREYYDILKKHSPSLFYKNLYELNLENKNEIAVIVHGFYLDLWRELLGA